MPTSALIALRLVLAVTLWAMAVTVVVQTRVPARRLILDGEANPAGGIGLCKQLKDEIAECPPILVLIIRVADSWLATWSRADAVSMYPVDPVRLPSAVADLLRARLGRAA